MRVELVHVFRQQVPVIQRCIGLRRFRIALRVQLALCDCGIEGARPFGNDDRPMVRKAPSVLISALIESRYGRRITEIRQEIRATTVSESIAVALQVESGTTALNIIRWYLDAAGQVFEISVSIHPAERFAVSMHLKRSDSHAEGKPGESKQA
jgi:DNA-binding GntR family transcriptional regulator